MKLENAFNKLDELLKSWFAIDSAEESEYYSRRKKLEENMDMLYDARLIDTKCSALLTHISIMFIVIGVFISNENTHGVFFLFMVIEFIAYVLSALLLLRCLDLMGPPFRQLPESSDAIRLAYLMEITIRREIYARVLRMVYMLTGILIPIIVLKYFL